jgi:glycosyltransferase involved in cell wall biosynthesis
MTKTKVLYISYDGMTDPLGQSQVLSYLKILSRYEYSFHVLSYEKKDRYLKHKDFVSDFIRGHDIEWHPLPYTNTPPIVSTVRNIQKGKSKIKELTGTHDFRIVHCRGYIASVMGEWLKNTIGAKFIFDMRGWWPDEKKEAGEWNSKVFRPVYKYFKKRERGFFENSDLSISLTEAGKDFITSQGLKPAAAVGVIPTCVNFDVFPAFDPKTRKEVRDSLDLPGDATVMVYSGSLGGNYRTDIVLRFFKHLLEEKPNSFFLFITHSSPELVQEEIQKSGVSKDRFRQVHSTYALVHKYLMAGDLGIVIYNTGFSVIGRSPTKLGEYWACGLKVLSVRGIGDLDHLMKQYPGGGALAEKMDDESSLKGAVKNVLASKFSKEELRSYATAYFDLEKGCSEYLKYYRQLT